MIELRYLLLLISPQEEKHYLLRCICVRNSRSLSVTRGAMIQCHIAAPRQERFYKDGIHPGDVLALAFKVCLFICFIFLKTNK